MIFSTNFNPFLLENGSGQLLKTNLNFQNDVMIILKMTFLSFLEPNIENCATLTPLMPLLVVLLQLKRKNTCLGKQWKYFDNLTPKFSIESVPDMMILMKWSYFFSKTF